jgi:PAS domain S-box-containing protein
MGMAASEKPKTKRFTIFPQEIRGSLLLAFCLLFLLFLFLGLSALQQASEVDRRTELIVENYRQGSQAFSQLGNFAFELDTIAREGMRAADIRTRRLWTERLTKTKSEIDSYIAQHLRTSSNPAEREALQELQKGVQDYSKALEGTMRLIRRGGTGKDRLLLSDSRLLSSQKRLRVERERLFSLYERAALQRQREISSIFSQFRSHTLALICITLLLGISIMYFSRRDIQRKANQIKEERDFSQTLIEAMGDGVVLFNSQEEIEFANRRFSEMLRYAPEEIIGKGYPQLFHPEDLPEAKRHSSVPADQRVHTFESRLIRADGSSFSALITVAPRLGGTGEHLGSVAVFRDITMRKEAERSIEQLARALEETDEVVVVTDLEENITYVNRAAVRTYGYEKEELIGRHVSLLRTPDDHLFLGPEIRAASLSQGWRGEIMNRRRTGQAFPISLTTSLLRDEKAAPYGVVGISRDISERKKIQEEIIRRNRELGSLNAIAATLSQSLNLEETLDRALLQIMEAVDADGGEIYVRREDGSSRPVQVACRGMEKDHSQQQSLPDIEPPWSKPMAFAESSIVIDDLRKEGIHSSLLAQGFLSFASIPIKSKGAILGVLNVGRKKLASFAPSEIELLEAAGNQTGMFVENVRFLERERRRVEELSTLTQVAQSLNSSLDLQKVLESIVSMAAKAMHAPAANLMLLDADTAELHWSANVGLPREWIATVGNLKVGESISGLVVSTGCPLCILDMSKDSRFLHPQLAERFGFRSFLGVPLISRGRSLGGLFILTTEPRCFSEREIRLLSAMADHAALAIENASLFREAEQLARDNFRRYQEVSILNEVGAAMRSTVQLDQLLPIILTGVTFGGGLGFNRAILFLVDEKGEVLEGVLGMGPSSPEDAAHIWGDLEREKLSLRADPGDLPQIPRFISFQSLRSRLEDSPDSRGRRDSPHRHRKEELQYRGRQRT